MMFRLNRYALMNILSFHYVLSTETYQNMYIPGVDVYLLNIEYDSHWKCKSSLGVFLKLF